MNKDSSRAERAMWALCVNRWDLATNDSSELDQQALVAYTMEDLGVSADDEEAMDDLYMAASSVIDEWYEHSCCFCGSHQAVRLYKVDIEIDLLRGNNWTCDDCAEEHYVDISRPIRLSHK